MSVAFGSLGLGILLGALSLFGEVWTLRDQAKHLMAHISRDIQNQQATAGPIYGNRPKLFSWAERLCYLFLSIAVLSLVAYAIVSG
jgi:hypothetical protein